MFPEMYFTANDARLLSQAEHRLREKCEDYAKVQRKKTVLAG